MSVNSFTPEFGGSLKAVAMDILLIVWKQIAIKSLSREDVYLEVRTVTSGHDTSPQGMKLTLRYEIYPQARNFTATHEISLQSMTVYSRESHFTSRCVILPQGMNYEILSHSQGMKICPKIWHAPPQGNSRCDTSPQGMILPPRYNTSPQGMIIHPKVEHFTPSLWRSTSRG